MRLVWFSEVDNKTPINYILLESKKTSLSVVLKKTDIKKRLVLLFEGFLMVEITRLFWKKAVTSDNFVLGEVESAELRY